GYQSVAGVTPDISVFGKAIANGYPLGVIGGQREIMDLFDHPDPTKRVLIAGTYNAHPINAVAAITVMRILQNEDVYHRIHSMSNRLYEGLEIIFKEKGIPAVTTNNASAFCTYFTEKAPADLHDVLEHHDFDFDIKYRRALIQNGIYHIPISAKQGSVSYAHSEADIDFTLEMTSKIVKEI
ncbi:MAG: aminotransferase class III-fold pyridoxal phosphate-dependent enzyme, partial [Ginsengibacter sp.]